MIKQIRKERWDGTQTKEGIIGYTHRIDYDSQAKIQCIGTRLSVWS